MPRLKWPSLRFGPVNLNTVISALDFYRLRNRQEDTKPRSPGCLARQYSDQMHCPGCGITWDMNDDCPPPCMLSAKGDPSSQ